jgi:hypothetical protein
LGKSLASARRNHWYIEMSILQVGDEIDIKTGHKSVPARVVSLRRLPSGELEITAVASPTTNYVLLVDDTESEVPVLLGSQRG